MPLPDLPACPSTSGGRYSRDVSLRQTRQPLWQKKSFCVAICSRHPRSWNISPGVANTISPARAGLELRFRAAAVGPAGAGLAGERRAGPGGERGSPLGLQGGGRPTAAIAPCAPAGCSELFFKNKNRADVPSLLNTPAIRKWEWGLQQKLWRVDCTCGRWQESSGTPFGGLCHGGEMWPTHSRAPLPVEGACWRAGISRQDLRILRNWEKHQ